MLAAWLLFWDELTQTPSDYKDDPYAALVGQLGHYFVTGGVGVLILSLLIFVGWHEYPYKIYILASVIVGYMAFEIYAQEWRGADTLIDWYYTVIGAASALYSFSEISAGGASMVFDPVRAVVCLFVLMLSLIIYLHPRVMRRYGNV